MIRSIYIDNYRSVKNVFLELDRLNIVFGPNGCGKSNIYKAIQLLSGAASGQLSEMFSSEGGIQNTMWSGKNSDAKARRICLSCETDDFDYELQIGFPDTAPDNPTLFKLDSVVKEEHIWTAGYKRRPSSQVLKRKNQVVFLSNIHGEKITHSDAIYENESFFGQLGEPHLYPEVSQLRETIKNWRFYHEFDVSRKSPIRQPQIGFRSPVLSSDGSNLASAFQTIVEIGDIELLTDILLTAFPECSFFCKNDNARFMLYMNRQGLARPLETSEMSDGTLRFLCLAVALLSPRPPNFIVLNEPENSLHPQMLPALAKLISQASRYSQIWLTSHSHELATLIGKYVEFQLYELSISNGQTCIHRV
ncbi:AAA family ATPase [Klebsiella sp. BIGb0407]|uniref:AAA family ATPase n=1 Tax=Klebsiella sp. BIGb0407 TaxID=2940603 RepID=UPI002168604B|nr:AAA family ATPase [Klebsiella sp. BIGb0407]MCS3432218.1 putative ATPase [Klebsiella sp. BIGb0407]